MNEVDLNHFDKLLLEIVFQGEQELLTKENTKEVIQRYSAKTLLEKQQIFALEKDIKLSDEIIWDLQNYIVQPSELSLLYTPTYEVLKREEAFLQNQLDIANKTTENDKKMYQDSVNKYKNILKQHQEKYKNFTLAKQYHTLKQELDDLQNVILNYDLQFKRKDKNIIDIMEPVSFASYIDWSLRLATLRKNTNETLEHISEISHATSEMLTLVKQLGQKKKHINEHTIETPDLENNTTVQPMEFQPRIFNEGESGLSQSNKKPFSTHFLHLPDLRHKLVQSQREGKENVDKDNKCSSILSRPDHYVDRGKQISEALSYNENKDHTSPSTNLRSQLQLRFAVPEKQIHGKQNCKQTGSLKEQLTDAPDISKDSGYASQNSFGSYREVEYKPHEDVSSSEVFSLPKIQSSFAVPDTPSPETSAFIGKTESIKGKKYQNVKPSTVDQCSSTMENNEKSLDFNFFKTSTPKTINFGSFSSTFGSINLEDQQSSFPGVDSNTASPLKDIGTIFGNMEEDNAFAFSFASRSSQASDDDKEDFRFMLPFGQELKTPKDSSFMEFEPPQSKMKFTFF